MPSLDQITPLPSPLLVMIVTTEGATFWTIAGIPGCAPGAAALDADAAVARGLALWLGVEHPAATPMTASTTTDATRFLM
jgi:hypothetical protein